MLIVFAGLPGSGKTTVARLLASRLTTVFLRIDEVEQAIREQLRLTYIGATGYAAAQAVAGCNLAMGRTVVVDCVNPVRASREGWRAVAAEAGATLIDVEIRCSDAEEHRRRVETRVADIRGLALPDWAQVLRTTYEPWDRPRVVIDSAALSPSDAVERIVAQIGSACAQSMAVR